MKKRIFILTDGHYEEYQIDGVFESALDLDDSSVIDSLKLKFHKHLGFDCIIKSNLKTRHKELVTGLKTPKDVSILGNPHKYREYLKELREIDKKYAELGFSDDSTSFKKWLIDNAYLNKLDYTEIYEEIE